MITLYDVIVNGFDIATGMPLLMIGIGVSLFLLTGTSLSKPARTAKTDFNNNKKDTILYNCSDEYRNTWDSLKESHMKMEEQERKDRCVVKRMKERGI